MRAPMNARIAEHGVTCNMCSAEMVGDGSAIARLFRSLLFLLARLG